MSGMARGVRVVFDTRSRTQLPVGEVERNMPRAEAAEVALQRIAALRVQPGESPAAALNRARDLARFALARKP